MDGQMRKDAISQSANREGRENAVAPTNGNQSVDLNTGDFDEITSPVEFRLYFWFSQTGSSGSAAEFDNFSLNGTSVPEPASIALLALGGLTLLARRNSDMV